MSRRHWLRAGLLTAALTCIASVSTEQTATPHYLSPDGSVTVIASPSTLRLLQALNAAFAQTHAGPHFTLTTDPSGYLALSGVTTGVAALAPLTHEAYPVELRPFLQTHQYAPLDVVVAHMHCTSSTGMPSPGLYVNARLPKLEITWQTVGRVLTRGAKGGDITQWKQLGIEGAWSHHVIHVYGPADDGGFVSALRHASFDGNPLTYRYEALPSSKDIAAAVSSDLYGIALIEQWEETPPTAGLRLVEVRNGNQAFLDAGRVRNDAGPFATSLHFYLDAGKSGHVDPRFRLYLEFVLSAVGQQALMSAKPQGGCRAHTLSSAEAAAQLARLR